MKARALIACIAAVAAIALLAGCQPGIASGTGSCGDCHSRDTMLGQSVLAAQTQHEESGHLNGPRMLNPSPGEIYEFEGSSAYGGGAGASCNKCHTHEGFIDLAASGFSTTYTGKTYMVTTPPGCFTCHQPHDTEDFSLRKISSETLLYNTPGQTSYDGGDGNLCVTCHKSRRHVSEIITGSAVNWGSSTGAHHGPQAEFLMGTNHWDYGSGYVGQSPHKTDTRAPDTCVFCHIYIPTARLGSLELGGHGMYLTAEVSGAAVDVIAKCNTCHSSYADTLTGSFVTSGPFATRLNNIKANRDILISYFGDGATYFTGDGTGPIESPSGTDVTSGEWGKDWVFASASLSDAQSKIFWNFKLFIEDKSQGIHNPVFAHQILYDAVEALNLLVTALPDPVWDASLGTR